MKRFIVGILLVSLLLVPVFVSADESSTTETRTIIESLLSVFPDLTLDLISELRAQGYGYGEIAIICIIASKSDNTLTDVINYAKENNLGWGEVAKHFGVELSKVGIYINSQKKVDDAGLKYIARERHRIEENAQNQNQYKEQHGPQGEQTVGGNQHQYQHKEQNGPGNKGSK